MAGPAAPWGYLGIVPLLTRLVGSCLVYTVFGVSTCKTKSADSS